MEKKLEFLRRYYIGRRVTIKVDHLLHIQGKVSSIEVFDIAELLEDFEDRTSCHIRLVGVKFFDKGVRSGVNFLQTYDTRRAMQRHFNRTLKYFNLSLPVVVTKSEKKK